jgi:hypothetical protein
MAEAVEVLACGNGSVAVLPTKARAVEQEA